MSDEGGLKDLVAKVLSDNPGQLTDYKSGKTKLRQFFFGEVMKVTRAKAIHKSSTRFLMNCWRSVTA